MDKKCLKELLILALPILAGNLGQILINFGDVYVSGHYKTEALAAISVASAIFMTIIISGIGILSAITPVLSNYKGEGRQTAKYFSITIIFSQVLAIIFFIVTNILIKPVELIGLNEEILSDVVSYLKISAYSIFGIFLYSAVKEFLQVYEKVFFANFIMVLAVILNIVLNFMFVYGTNFTPKMGTSGLAAASLIVRIFLGVILLSYASVFFKKSKLKNSKQYIKDIMKVGLPIGGAVLIEFTGFNTVAVLVGRMESFYAAAHNIIISMSSLSYMAPFSIQTALSVKSGNANGSRDYKLFKKYTQSAILFIIFYSFIISLIYFVYREQIMKLFSNDINVIKTGSAVMIVVCLYMIFDCLQCVALGALKGLKKAKQIFITMFLSYIIISIPLGLLLGYKLKTGLLGFWIGLAAGLFTASVFMCTFLIVNYNKAKINNNTEL